MGAFDHQIGFGIESSYGDVAATITRFYDAPSFDIQYNQGRVESAGMRAGAMSLTEDDFEVYANGGTITVTGIPVRAKNMGQLFKWIWGGSSIGAAVASVYPMTFTDGDLYGTWFSTQIYRAFPDAAAGQAFTARGCKVVGGKLYSAHGDYLKLDLSIDFREERLDFAKAAATYVSAPMLPFKNSTIQIAAADYHVTGGWELSWTTPMKVERKSQINSGLKKEPVQNGRKQWKLKLTGEWESATHYNRYVDSTAANTMAAITISNKGTTDIAAGVKPELLLTMPKCRAEGKVGGVSGPAVLDEPLEFTVMKPLAAAACTGLYQTLDSAL